MNNGNEIGEKPEPILDQAELDQSIEILPGFEALLENEARARKQESKEVCEGSSGATDGSDPVSGTRETQGSTEPGLEMNLSNLYDQLILRKAVMMIMEFRDYNNLRTSLVRKHKQTIESFEKIGIPCPQASLYVASSFDRSTQRVTFELKETAKKSTGKYRVDGII